MPALEGHPNAVMTAACGRNPERTAAFAEKHGIAHHFTDYRAMFASGEIDAVIISTVNKTHYPMTMDALAAGLHVLCEKPLALTVAESAEMTQKAQETGLKCMVPFTYRFMPTNRTIKQLINDGYIGKPYHLNLRYYTGYARDGQYLWRMNKAEAGAGPIGDIGSHFIYLAVWFFGKVESVICQLHQMIERDPMPDGSDYERTDDGGQILLQFKNGAQGVIVASALCYEETPFGQTHHGEFHGSDGTLYSFIDWDTIQQVRGARVGEGMIAELPIPDEIWGSARRDTVHNTYKDTFREQDVMARGWITSIVEDTEPEPSFAEGLYVQRVLEACLLSAKEDRRVLMTEV